MDIANSNIEQRLDKLESTNQLLKFGFGIAIVIAIVGICIGLRPLFVVPSLIRAHAIEVVDSRGEVGVELNVANNHGLLITHDIFESEELVRVGKSLWGGGRIQLGNGSGYTSVSIGSNRGSGAVATYGKLGRELISLGASKDSENGMLVTYRENGDPATFIGSGAAYLGTVATFGIDGKIATSLSCDPDYNGSLKLYANTERVIVSAHANENECGSIVTYNQNEKMVVGLGTNGRSQSGFVTINDKNENRMIGFGQSELNKNTISLFGNNNNEILRMSSGENGSGLMAMNGVNGNTLLWLGGVKHAGGIIMIYDERKGSRTYTAFPDKEND